MWHSNDTFYYMFKADFVTLISLKVPWGSPHKIISLKLEGDDKPKMLSSC